MMRNKILSLLSTGVLTASIAFSSISYPVLAAGSNTNASGSDTSSAVSENGSGSTSAGTSYSDEEADPAESSNSTEESKHGSDDGNTTADPASNKAGTAAADQYKTIHVTSIYDLEEVAENSKYDKWSQDKRVVLDTDINLAGTDIRIASFGGIFDGQYHTISNLTINGKEAEAGFFDNIQKTGLVEKLNVTGSLRPSGTQNIIGGIAGTNYGTIRNCRFNGTVEADAQVGGIVGRNETSGIVESSSAVGEATGRSYTGGIAGYNAGTLTRCSSSMAVNTTYTDTSVSTDQISNTLENIMMTGRINTTENIQARTDSGGIAGYSSGVIYSCTNSGEVGYEHVGYNVGGVVGRSTGYVQSCENRGLIKGRKDVGGIVGQQQPYLRLQFSENFVDKLEGQIDDLKDTTDGILGSANGTTGTVNSLVNQIANLATSANGNLKTIADQSKEDLNETTDKLNNARDTLNDALDQTSDIVGQVNQQLENLKTSATNLNNTLNDYAKSIDLSDSDRAKLNHYYDLMRDNIDDASDAAKDLNNWVSGRTDKTIERVEKSYEDIQTIATNVEQAIRNAQNIIDILSDPKTVREKDQNTTGTDNALLKEAGNKFNESAANAILKHLQGGLAEIVNTVTERVPGDIEGQIQDLLAGREPSVNEDTIRKFTEAVIKAGGGAADVLISENVKGLTELVNLLADREDQVTEDINKAAEELYGTDGTGGILNNPEYDFSWKPDKNNPDQQDARTVASDDMHHIIEQQGKISAAIKDLRELSNKKIPDDLDAWKDLVGRVRSDLNTITDGIADMGKRAVDIMDILHDHLNGIQNLEESGVYQALQNVINSVNDNDAITRQVQDVLAEIAGIDVSMNGVSDTVSQAGDNLYGSVNDIISVMQSLNNQLSNSSSDIINRAKTLNDQINDIAHTLRDELDKETSDDDDDEGSDILEDQSDIDYSDVTQGRTTDSTNRGEIQADNNVGGVVGTVGVEFDLDPEEDIQRIGNSSLDYDFFARAVIDHCVNWGKVESKNNYCGGIAAHMEMGYVDASEGYGQVKGGADYAGGISGYSAGTIRGSYAKCDVSGARYVGGIAGYGTKLYDNVSMVNVSDSTQYVGAIAGKVNDIDKDVTGNVFVANNLRGIDGVSYDGIAQGTTYKKLQENDQLPADYDVLHLTFAADDDTVAVIDVPYGSSVTADQLPMVPVKNGFIGKWERTNFSRVTRDRTVKAIYTRALDVAATSAVREGGSPILLVEGNFSQKDTVSLIPETAGAGETERWRVGVPGDAQNGMAPSNRSSESPSGDTDAGTSSSNAGKKHTFRYLAVDGSTEHTTLYLVNEDGSRKKLKTGTNGKYLTFEAEGSQFVFAAETDENGNLEKIELLGGVAGAAALVAVILVIRMRRRRRRKNKTGQA